MPIQIFDFKELYYHLICNSLYYSIKYINIAVGTFPSKLIKI